jgi:hypothetical protein
MMKLVTPPPPHTHTTHTHECEANLHPHRARRRSAHRMIIRIAASEIYLKAEKANLSDQVARLRKTRDTLVAQAATSRTELERTQVHHLPTLPTVARAALRHRL